MYYWANLPLSLIGQGDDRKAEGLDQVEVPASRALEHGLAHFVCELQEVLECC